MKGKEKKTKKVDANNFESDFDEKSFLYEKMLAKNASEGEIMRLSFLLGITSKKEYKIYLETEKWCKSLEG